VKDFEINFLLQLCQDILRVADKNKVISSVDQQAYLFQHIFDEMMKLLKDIFFCNFVPEAICQSLKAGELHHKRVIQTFRNKCSPKISCFK